jgi:hypothetical protein
MISFGGFPGVSVLITDVSEHCICSIFKGRSKKTLGTESLHIMWVPFVPQMTETAFKLIYYLRAHRVLNAAQRRSKNTHCHKVHASVSDT